MAYGTPANLAAVGPYYTHIRRGRPPEPAQLRELMRRYQSIGGSSPLLVISRTQARGLQLLLDPSSQDRFRVQLGMKHAAPFIEDGVRALIRAGAQHAVGLVLAPHYSALRAYPCREESGPVLANF
jgi:protoporphyrin/coproporphyrin ferrochelatase